MSKLDDLYHRHIARRQRRGRATQELTAISLQASRWLWNQLENIRPQTIIDLGSGFSTLLFAHYVKTVEPLAEVHSYETSDGYLRLTERDLFAEQLNDHVTTLNLFRPGMTELPNAADFIFHDLNGITGRHIVLPLLIEPLLQCMGVLVLDDWNNQEYRDQANKELEKYGLHAEDILTTKDQYGRYLGWVQC